MNVTATLSLVSLGRSFHTWSVHAGSSADNNDHYGALSVPVYRSSVYGFESLEVASAVHEGDAPGYFYGRLGGPTQSAFETAIAQLEGAEAALATASGMAAIATTILTILSPGDELVAAPELYTTTRQLLDTFVTDHGIRVRYSDSTDARDLVSAFSSSTRAVFVETPSNPTLGITDLEYIATSAIDRGIWTLADNTFATPFNQTPIELGFDLVCHSATKFLGGHADLMAGVVAGRAEIIDKARWKTNKMLGAVISADSAWLALRGLRTLAVRMERHNESAQTLAEWLANQELVAAVNYPGLESHPGHTVAKKQMRGYGGVLSFDIGTADAAQQLVENVRICRLAVSLGDVATLVQVSADLTQAALSEEERRLAGVSTGLVRLSVGLEDVEDIKDDLGRALRTVG